MLAHVGRAGKQMLAWSMTKKPWWKLEHKTRHPRINKDTTIYVGNGCYKSIQKGCFISPVRKCFLPHGHWILDRYDETSQVAADTPIGFGLVDLVDIDW
jgi:hypothetical protein